MNYKEILSKVLQAALIGAIFWLGNAVKDLVMEVHDLRYDVDRLYYEVSEIAKQR
jgi:hypothetical protein